jgi:hypothetical protein
MFLNPKEVEIGLNLLRVITPAYPAPPLISLLDQDNVMKWYLIFPHQSMKPGSESILVRLSFDSIIEIRSGDPALRTIDLKSAVSRLREYVRRFLFCFALRGASLVLSTKTSFVHLEANPLTFHNICVRGSSAQIVGDPRS